MRASGRKKTTEKVVEIIKTGVTGVKALLPVCTWRAGQKSEKLKGQSWEV